MEKKGFAVAVNEKAGSTQHEESITHKAEAEDKGIIHQRNKHSIFECTTRNKLLPPCTCTHIVPHSMHKAIAMITTTSLAAQCPLPGHCTHLPALTVAAARCRAAVRSRARRAAV